MRVAESRNKPEGYSEEHHIFPKSIYGENDRLVFLTAREHYIAHALLERIMIKRYGFHHPNSVKMCWAFNRMNSGNQYQEVHFNTRLFEAARIRKSQHQSVMFSGYNNPFYGKKHTSESLENMSNVKKGKLNPMFGKKRPEHSKNMIVKMAKKWKLTKSNGDVIIITNLSKFCKDNGFSQGNLNGVMNGNVKICYGFVSVEKINVG